MRQFKRVMLLVFVFSVFSLSCSKEKKEICSCEQTYAMNMVKVEKTVENLPNGTYHFLEKCRLRKVWTYEVFNDENGCLWLIREGIDSTTMVIAR